MEDEELMLFIPGPGIGHLVPAVELGKLLITRDEHLSIVFLIIQLSVDTGVVAYIESQLADPTSKIRFVKIPPPQMGSSNKDPESKNRYLAGLEMVGSVKPLVRDAVLEILSNSATTTKTAAGVVVDLFSDTMIDVANEFELPSYVLYTSSAGFLGLHLHVQTLFDDQNVDITDYKDSEEELLVPSFMQPVPAKVLPTAMLDKNGGSEAVFSSARRIRETKGIIVNTFQELESYAIKSLSDNQQGRIPPVYPIGPMINWNFSPDHEGVLNWLDTQPDCSVVFLCFGTFGSFGLDQVKEIALALEHSRCRFLWSLRQPPTKGSIAAASAYPNPDEILPQGFLKRTSGVGKVIGWAPQMEILSHAAVGGFVSHCGWNSILESLWAGVPMAAWPMDAEQQSNAFEMVEELGLSVEIKMDYRHEANMESQIIVSADEIESGIKRILMQESGIREKVKGVSEKCRKAMLENGSSYISLANLVQNIRKNVLL